MMKSLFFFISLLLSCVLSGQEPNDWPFIYLDYHINNNNPVSYQICNGSSKQHRVVEGSYGKEYYCSGNLHAQGPLILADSSIVINLNNKEEKNYK